MKKVGLIILVLTLATAGGLALQYYLSIPKEEGVAHLKTVSSVAYLYEYDVVNFFWALDKEPESLSGMPENISGDKTFFSIPFRDGNLTCCLFDKGNQDYTLYADLNGNNSLSDEKPIQSHKKNYRHDGSLYVFGPLSLNDPGSAAFYLILSNHLRGIHVAPTTVQKGKIRINNQIHEIMLADLDFDGKYQTYFSAESLLSNTLGRDTFCDRLLFDIDGDGRFINRYFTQMECMPLPKILNIYNSRYYALELRDKKLLTTPLNPELGTLRLNTYQSSLHLCSDTCSYLVDAVNLIQLPAGRYSIIYNRNNFTDPNENVWTCWSRRDAVGGRSFVIAPNAETQVEFPTTFLLTTDVSYVEGNCSIGVQLVDSGKAVYAVAIQKNGQTVAKPVITIYDEKQAAIHSGTMEYG
ncbi:MAG: hypothetical protein LLF76_03400 [Planctomycetaceae bacterium]|nr:hypothetical protein [Planctomycetaceae bacterium]